MTESTAKTGEAQEAWLLRFDQSSPQGRHAMVREALAQADCGLSQNALSYAVASVNEMLSHFNLIEDMNEIAALLQQNQPAIYAQMLPAINMFEIEKALFEGQPGPIPELLQGLLAYQGPLPDALWLTLLDKLAFYGHPGLAGKLAADLAASFGPERLAEETLLNGRISEHQLLWAVEQAWAGELDDAGYAEVVKRIGYDDDEMRTIAYQQRDASGEDQLAALLNKFRQRATFSAVHNGQMAFARYMHGRGLNVYTSAEIMSHVVMMWRQNPERNEGEDFSLETLVRLSPAQLEEVFNGFDEDPDAGLDVYSLFAWGLPLVYDWLHAQGLVTAEQVSELHDQVDEMKEAVMEQGEGGLWYNDFVHRWPRPALQSEAEFAAEAARFRADFEAREPLSDDPADSALFDAEDEDGDFPDEEGLAFMMSQLAGLSPQEKEKMLGMLAEEFGPEAAEGMKGMLDSPDQALQMLMNEMNGK